MGVRRLLELTNRVALVTGASRGLGLQIAEALAEMGAKLAVTARKADDLAQAREHLERQGGTVLAVPCDHSDPGSIQSSVEKILAHYGQLDILVNNAGTAWGAPAEEHPLFGWRKVMDLNVTGLFLTTQQVASRSMIPRRYGRIVNVASIDGLVGTDPSLKRTISYNTSKGAVVNLTRSLAAEWGRHGITVNAIAPGFFESRMTHQLLQEIGATAIARTPLGRLGGEEDLKGLAVLLASDASAHITGQIIAVDGGATAI